MACACKAKSANVVKPVKQVVKKLPAKTTTPNTTVKKTTIKRISYRRPI